MAAAPGRARVAISPAEPLYGPDGNRIGEPLRFGRGTLCHLLRHGREYDVVHMASFPYFSVLAAAVAQRRGGYRLVVDWHELWSGRTGTATWAARGRLGHRSRPARACRTAPSASRGRRERLLAEGFAARSACSRASYAGERAAVRRRAARRLRGTPHRREARAGRRAGDARRPGRAPELRGASSATGRERPQCLPRSRTAADRHRARARLRRRRRARRPCAAPSAWCCRQVARAMGWSSSRRRRRACRASSSPARTTPRSSSSTRAQRLRRGIGRAGGPRRRHPPRARGRPTAAHVDGSLVRA